MVKNIREKKVSIVARLRVRGQRRIEREFTVLSQGGVLTLCVEMKIRVSAKIHYSIVNKGL